MKNVHTFNRADASEDCAVCIVLEHIESWEEHGPTETRVRMVSGAMHLLDCPIGEVTAAVKRQGLLADMTGEKAARRREKREARAEAKAELEPAEGEA